MREYKYLNDLLGRELGRNPYGESIFRWDWSEEMFWPAFATGQRIMTQRAMPVPVIGHGEETVMVEESTPEYVQTRQTRLRDTWLISKWMSPEQLIWGWIGRHGGEVNEVHPDHEHLVALWESRFPGADFPHRGWRIPTEASLPRSPDDPKNPNLADTEHFIRCIREQTSMSAGARLMDMLNWMNARDERERAALEPQIAECFPAMLNPNPGKRGGGWSFPWTKFNR